MDAVVIWLMDVDDLLTPECSLSLSSPTGPAMDTPTGCEIALWGRLVTDPTHLKPGVTGVALARLLITLLQIDRGRLEFDTARGN